MAAALAPPGTPTEAQGQCFPQTNFCITNQQFGDYFRMRGDVKTLGYPISRSFTLDGFEVQFFQRVVLQLQGGQVQRLNVLDPGIMPMTRVNQSQFPPNDPQIAARAPATTSPTYATDVVQFIQTVSPNSFNGQAVNFFNTFNNAVPSEAAGGNPGLQTLLNLEIWGLPTSNPAPDPGNGGFIYQRYQRGIMHFDASCGCTQGILVGEYLKAVITGRSLPSDLNADMQGSRFLNQYSPGSPGWVARPGELPNTDMNGAFEPGTGPVTQPSAPAATPVPAAGAATATPTVVAGGPSVTVQLSDARIDPGQSTDVTVIANYATAIDWIEFDGIASQNNNENDNDAAADQQLARQRFDCDDRTQCANVWTISPTVSGQYTIRARSRGVDQIRSEWVTVNLRVNGGSATATPTATHTPAPPTATTGTAPSGSPTP